MAKFPAQASGGDEPGNDDGVSKAEAGGRTGGGERGGGAYTDPDQVKGYPDHGILGRHGGQSNIAYHGPGDVEGGGTNPNAPTKRRLARCAR